MIRLGDLIRPITSRLRANKAEFAVIGGLAVSARTVPRFTKDVDFAVMVENDAEAERLVYEVARDGFQIVTLIDQTATNRLATARLSLSGGGPEEPVIIRFSQRAASNLRWSERPSRSNSSWESQYRWRRSVI